MIGERIPTLRLYSVQLTTTLRERSLRPLMRRKNLGVTVCDISGLRRADHLGMRLLVVEDNEELAQLLAKGLEGAGFGADLATMAVDARTALATARYAAVILDLGLPDGDGLAILLTGSPDCVAGPMIISESRLPSKSSSPGWKPYCAGPASCSGARFASATSYSTPRVGKPRSMTNRSSCPPAKWRC
jgi:hypothetical protein